MHVRPVVHAPTLTVRPLTLAVHLGIGNWEGMKDLYYWHATLNAHVSRHTAVLLNVSYILWGDNISYYYPILSLAGLCAVGKPRHCRTQHRTSSLHACYSVAFHCVNWICQLA